MQFRRYGLHLKPGAQAL
uniref:Uncharacterized protein n=1 Tax=Anguilla anguilla TaxID=7936 RepID=A0A0E9T8D7_ANGAN